MKVIFLDNDGVICLSSNWGGRSKKIQKYYKANPEWDKMYKSAPVDVRFDNFVVYKEPIAVILIQYILWFFYF